MKIREPKDNLDLVPGVLREGQETTDRKFEMEFFLLTMPVSSPKNPETYDYGILKVHEFPNINRGVPCGIAEYKGYLQKYSKLSTQRRFADFNLLVYIADLLGVETSVEIGRRVATETPLPDSLVDIMRSII